MPLNIRSEEVNRLAAELAARKGVSKTEAVKLALVKALDERSGKVSEAEKARRLAAIRELQREIASYPRTGLEADKAFYDSLNDE